MGLVMHGLGPTRCAIVSNHGGLRIVKPAAGPACDGVDATSQR